MKKLVALMATLMLGQAFAETTYRLNNSEKVRVMRRGVLISKGHIYSGNTVTVDRRDYVGPRAEFRDNRGMIRTSRGRFFRLVDIGNYRRADDRVVNALDNERRVYISASAIRNAIRIDGRRDQNHYRPSRPHTPIVNNPVIVNENFNSYDVCYKQPYNTWYTTNEKQAKIGRRNAGIGAVLGLGGLLLSGSNDRTTRDIGTAVAIGGAALGAIGLVQMANSQSVFTSYADQCTRHYKMDPVYREPVIRGVRCRTYRYYSNSWDREVEYFQTTCSGTRYYSFNRRNVWY